MHSQLPHRLDRITKHFSVLLFIAGFLAVTYELTGDHRASGEPPLSQNAVEFQASVNAPSEGP